MLIFAIIILMLLPVILYGLQKGLNFEEKCAARIQANHYQIFSDHISMEESRQALRITVDALVKWNRIQPTMKLISLKTAREAAVEIHLLCLQGKEVGEGVIEVYDKL